MPRKEQHKNRMQYGELYHKKYYREIKDKKRIYYEFYHLDGTESVPKDYKEISFVCLRPDGSLELPSGDPQSYLIKWQAMTK